MTFRSKSPTAALGLIVLLLVAGCGKSEMPLRVDDAVQMTEDSLTDVLLGPREVDYTSLAPPDKPLLVKGVHDKVYIAVDDQGFIRLSNGTFTEESMKEIEERVVKTVNRNVVRHGFTAVATTFPTPADLAQEPHSLIATLNPEVQDTGSPRDRAEGRSKTLVLIRLTIADAATGTVLVERDYYSGNDVRRDRGTPTPSATPPTPPAPPSI